MPVAVGGIVDGVAKNVDSAVATVTRSVDTAVTDLETAVDPIVQGSLGTADGHLSGPVTSDVTATAGDIVPGDASLPGGSPTPGRASRSPERQAAFASSTLASSAARTFPTCRDGAAP